MTNTDHKGLLQVATKRLPKMNQKAVLARYMFFVCLFSLWPIWVLYFLRLLRMDTLAWLFGMWGLAAVGSLVQRVLRAQD